MGQEILYIIGAIVLLGALAYGTMQYSRRNRALDRVGEDVTRERYKHDDV